MALPAQYDGKSAAYAQWKMQYLHNFSNRQQHARTFRTLSLGLQGEQDTATLHSICASVKAQGFGLYRFSETLNADDVADQQLVTAIQLLHQRLGLQDSDQGVLNSSSGLSLLQDLKDSPQGKFVPYSNRQMNWHTDGYYNRLADTVRCFCLHCLCPASSGGRLSVLDPCRLLIALYDEDPALIELLTHPQAMLLPSNSDELGHDRPDRVAPVICCLADGFLVLRFTMRTKNIQWRNDETRQAAEHLVALVEKLRECHSHITLQRGEGIVTRNLLHKRDAFTDSKKLTRQMLRGRFQQDPVVKPSLDSETPSH